MVALTGRPELRNMLRYGPFFVHSHFPPLHILLFPPHSFSLRFPLPFHPTSQQVNKKLSYRGENALSVVHERNTASEHTVFMRMPV